MDPRVPAKAQVLILTPNNVNKRRNSGVKADELVQDLKKRRTEEQECEKELAELQTKLSRIRTSKSESVKHVVLGLKDLERQLEEKDQENVRLRRKAQETKSKYDKQASNQMKHAAFFASKYGVTRAYEVDRIAELYRDLLSFLDTPFEEFGVGARTAPELAPLPHKLPKNAYGHAPQYRDILVRTATGNSETVVADSFMTDVARSPAQALVRACILTALQVFLLEDKWPTSEDSDCHMLMRYREVLWSQRGKEIDGWRNVRNLDFAAHQQIFDEEMLNNTLAAQNKWAVESVARAIMPFYSEMCQWKTHWEKFERILKRSELGKRLPTLADAAWKLKRSKLLSPDWFGLVAPVSGELFDDTSMEAENDYGGPMGVVGEGRVVKLCRAPALLWVSAANRFRGEDLDDVDTALVKNNHFVAGETAPPSGKPAQVVVKATVLLEPPTTHDARVTQALRSSH